MTFSVIRPKRIHPRIHNEETIMFHHCFVTCGNKWKNASPNKAPAEKATRNKIIFWSKDTRIPNATIPINDIALTTNTLISAYQKDIWSIYKINIYNLNTQFFVIFVIMMIHSSTVVVCVIFMTSNVSSVLETANHPCIALETQASGINIKIPILSLIQQPSKIFIFCSFNNINRWNISNEQDVRSFHKLSRYQLYQSVLCSLFLSNHLTKDLSLNTNSFFLVSHVL